MKYQDELQTRSICIRDEIKSLGYRNIFEVKFIMGN